MSYLEALKRNGKYAAHIYEFDTYTEQVTALFTSPFIFASKNEALDAAKVEADKIGLITELSELSETT